MRRLLISSLPVLLAACGGAALPTARTLSSSQALTGVAEALEYEAPAARVELFRDVLRAGQAQAGQVASGPVLFPMLREGAFVAAPALDVRADLLLAADAGQAFQVTMDGRQDRWGDERRETFQGLSEREAAELVARSLVHLWALRPDGAVTVVRSPGAPWAAAWIDGELRLNPAFVVMAAALAN